MTRKEVQIHMMAIRMVNAVDTCTRDEGVI
jgi:hypothetical protein